MDQSEQLQHVETRFNEAQNLLNDISTSIRQGNRPSKLWGKFQSKCDEIATYVSVEIEAEQITSER